MVCVQTPSSEEGELDIQFIESVFTSAIQYLNLKQLFVSNQQSIQLELEKF